MQKVEIDIMYGLEGPQPKQVEFRDMAAYYKLFAGGVRAGKTRTLCAESLRLLIAFPGNRGLGLRQDGSKFESTTLEEMFKLIRELEQGLQIRIMDKWNKKERKLYFSNGSVFVYGGVDSTNRQTNTKSFECGFFMIDEASEIKSRDFDFLLSRTSWVLPSGIRPPYMGFLASNVEECWLYEYFVNKKTRRKYCGYVAAKTTDNEQFLPVGYVERLMKMNDQDWNNQYTQASWKFTKGRIFINLDPTIHCLAKFPAKKPQDVLYVGIDHGQSHPTTAVALYVDNDDNIFIYREYKEVGIVSEHCKALNIIFDGFKDFHSVSLDKSTWGKNREKYDVAWSVADEYMEHGIKVTPAYNDVDQGLARMLQLLNVDPNHKHPVTGKMGAPRLYIHKTNCPELIAEMEDYKQHKTRAGDFLDRPLKKNDDLVDAARYAIMSIGRIRMAYEPKKRNVNKRFEQLTRMPNEGTLVSW